MEFQAQLSEEPITQTGHSDSKASSRNLPLNKTETNACKPVPTSPHSLPFPSFVP